MTCGHGIQRHQTTEVRYLLRVCTHTIGWTTHPNFEGLPLPSREPEWSLPVSIRISYRNEHQLPISPTLFIAP